jgi:hypothetical protein
MGDGNQRLLTVEPVLVVVDLSAEAIPQAAMRALVAGPHRRALRAGRHAALALRAAAGRDTLHGLTIQFHHLVMDGWGTSLVMRAGARSTTNWPPAWPRRAAIRATCQYMIESNAYRLGRLRARRAVTGASRCRPCRRRWSSGATPRPRRRAAGGAAGAAGDRARRLRRAVRIAQARGSSAFNFFLAALALYFSARRRARRGGGRRAQPEPRRAPLHRHAGHVRRRDGGAHAVEPEMTRGPAAGRGGLGDARRAAPPALSLSELGRTLELGRNRREGLFDVLLSFERQDYAVSFGDAALVDSRQLFSGKARFPLGVTVCEFHADQDVELALEASAACFLRARSSCWAGASGTWCRPRCARARAASKTSPMLPQEEAWALIDGLHKDVACHDVVQPFIALFEHQAALRPEAVSLVWDGGSLDYGTLDRLSNQLGAPAAEPGRRPRPHRGHGDGPLGRHGDRPSWPSPRPAPPFCRSTRRRRSRGWPASSPKAMPRRCCCSPAAWSSWAGCTRAWCWSTGPRCRPSATAQATARRCAASSRVRPGLCAVHLRLHRPAQGRDDRTRHAGAPARRGCRAPTAWTGATAPARPRRSPSTPR